MLTFKDDPSGVIPSDFDSGEYRVVGFKLIRLKMYVMVEIHETKGVFQYPYHSIFRTCARHGKINR